MPGLIHEGVLAQVAQQFDGFRRDGFWAGLRELETRIEYEGEADTTSPLKASVWGFLPDGWFTTREENAGLEGAPLVTVHAVEIEDANQISAVKLQNYANFWMHMDAYCNLAFRLRTFDRNGTELKERDLWEWHCFFLKQKRAQA